jgi:hypothetical protein
MSFGFSVLVVPYADCERAHKGLPGGSALGKACRALPVQLQQLRRQHMNNTIFVEDGGQQFYLDEAQVEDHNFVVVHNKSESQVWFRFGQLEMQDGKLLTQNVAPTTFSLLPLSKMRLQHTVRLVEIWSAFVTNADDFKTLKGNVKVVIWKGSPSLRVLENLQVYCSVKMGRRVPSGFHLESSWREA